MDFDSIGIGSNPISPAKYGRMGEWLKPEDCKSSVTDFVGSNPTPSTICRYSSMVE